MTAQQLILSQWLADYAGFPWRDGMLADGKWRISGAFGVDARLLTQKTRKTTPIDPAWWPVLDDPATIGGLQAIAETAWNDPAYRVLGNPCLSAVPVGVQGEWGLTGRLDIAPLRSVRGDSPGSVYAMSILLSVCRRYPDGPKGERAGLRRSPWAEMKQARLDLCRTSGMNPAFVPMDSTR